jgi:hypothetical protein
MFAGILGMEGVVSARTMLGPVPAVSNPVKPLAVSGDNEVPILSEVLHSLFPKLVQ